jgi:uracil-DNA glycosylase
MISYDNIIKNIHPDWLPFFEYNKDELYSIISKLSYKHFYPLEKHIFRSLKYISVTDIKLIILGQDPYINIEKNIPQATGLSFSVPKIHTKIPLSLVNIFKEIKNSYPEYEIPKHGCLNRWAKEEKILLLNCSLTVEPGKSNSHKDLWLNFTNNLIKFINNNNDNTIFLLMGAFAINKMNLIDHEKHKIFTTRHPSPLSAYRGFFGCNVFKLVNEYLEEQNKEIINY